MRTFLAVALCCLAPLGPSSSARADVKLPAIFSDHMVLQSGVEIPVWGWASPRETVHVRIGGREATATADETGKWRARLAPLQATQAAAELAVQGKNSLRVRDVLVGEVWLASGQSNMEFGLRNASTAEQELPRANTPELRLFVVDKVCAPQPREDCLGHWTVCSPETAADFSAVAYFFGAAVQRGTRAPVGLIQAAWGGTPAEAWTSAAMLGDEPLFEPLLAARQKKLDDQLALDPHDAGTLWDGLLAPIATFPIRGAIWYQGESNVERALQYRALFPALIRGWRSAWGQGEFPFLFVQLASFRARDKEPGDSPWAELREAQAAALELPHTGMAVAIDVGDAEDIHPRNKQAVGERLAKLALRTVYGKDVACFGPSFAEVAPLAADGASKLRVRFEHAEGGLRTSDDAPVRGFAVAGEDQVFHWAQAKIDGDSVVLTSPEVPAPVAARYAWADNPDANLVNREGLPAAPLRTDAFPGMEERSVPMPSTERRKKRAGAK
jgi:sialate O-acetylesterase